MLVLIIVAVTLSIAMTTSVQTENVKTVIRESVVQVRMSQFKNNLQQMDYFYCPEDIAVSIQIVKWEGGNDILFR